MDLRRHALNDERLDAGRHHLAAGEEALQRRDVDASRDHFESAILQFAGPDLKMGEGHALRGLASVATAQRDQERAEALLRASITCFRDVRTLLDALDDAGKASSHRLDAMEAEATSQVQLGELLLRAGRVSEAVEARDWARAAFDGVGNRPSEATVYALTAHIARRQGDLEEAVLASGHVLSIHEASGDARGQALALQSLGETHRLLGALEEASEAQQRALHLARGLEDPVLEARTLAAIGLLASDRHEVDAALVAYEKSLALATSVDDAEGMGFAELNLANIRSRNQRGQPMGHFRRAVERLSTAGAEHAFGATLLYASEHALRIEQPKIALALATGCRRIWRTMDPIRGVSQALRVTVKALAADSGPEALLLVAAMREDVSGDVHGHAGKVADYYRERVTGDDLVRIEAMEAAERAQLADEYIQAQLASVLETFGFGWSDLASPRSALILLDELGALHEVHATKEPSEIGYHQLSQTDLLGDDG